MTLTATSPDFPASSVDLLARLVSFNTVSSNSNLELIGFLEAYFAHFGVATRRYMDETGEKANLLATIGPDTQAGYILSGHTDVVPVEGQDWSSDPFTLTERDGLLYGRGACDMKGFLACMLSAVPDMLAADLKRPIHLAFSYDEEVGCIGVRSLVEDMAGWPVTPAGCIVGEPTLMDVVIGHKTKRSLRVTVRGKTGHSSLAPQFVNAVDYAAMLVVKIREIRGRLEREGLRDELYDIPFTTSHTGVIQGGSQLNIVPDRCVFDYEFRVLPEEDADALVAEVEAYARTVLEPEMRAIDPACGIDFDWISQFPGLSTEPEADITLLTKRLSQRNGHSKVAYGTEAGLFQTVAHVPTIVCGPGSIEQAHRADEFIARSELEACDQFIRRLITHCCA
ncbi:acetylornithine deacetylase [Roseibium aestuarii]|uniref:Acetylornithine deacetylase n=1 Tax=Roseibium aestuarii TaxID=2600299 RepID=A0ABW4JU89_9HYPH|nr:acetylornithine deacetylase [Roseibium aestuarii]